METDIAAGPESQWSSLLEELLDEILSRLPLLDYLRFGSVCRSWRSAMLARRPPLPPLLLKPARPQLIFFFSSLVNGKLRELPMEYPFEMQQCLFGHSHGWLAMKSSYGVPYIVNPVSGDRIDFPPGVSSINNAVLSSPPTSGDCSVVVYGKFHHNNADIEALASCKLGDSGWTVFDESPWDTVSMAFHNGKLYVLCADGYGKVYACDPHPRIVGSVIGRIYSRYLGHIQLVGTGEELLLVAVPRYREYEVFKLEEGRWVRITSLGDRVLLLSSYNAYCLGPQEIMGSDFRRNCIYDVRMHGWYLEVYNMEDGELQRLPLPNDDLEQGWLIMQPN